MNRMDNIDKGIIEGYFNNTCTAEEARQVLSWFETSEGRAFLKKKLDSDIDEIEQDQIKSMVSELDSAKLLQSIRQRIQLEEEPAHQNKRDTIKILFKTAASVLVIITASLFYYTAYQPITQEPKRPTPVHYATADDQQKEVTLSDGTTIRLNSNSEIRISNDYLELTRQVELEGEAYFDVSHNPEKPFLIHANETKIEVLGTSFNVRTVAEENEVQLAVIEGSVSFSSWEGTLTKESVVLKTGQFAYVDLERHVIDVEEFAVNNYLFWMKGRLVFEELPLKQVCTQLNRLYDVRCDYADVMIGDLKLTADFSGDTLEKTLSVIALSLDITYKKSGDQITWMHGSYDHNEQWPAGAGES